MFRERGKKNHPETHKLRFDSCLSIIFIFGLLNKEWSLNQVVWSDASYCYGAVEAVLESSAVTGTTLTLLLLFLQVWSGQKEKHGFTIDLLERSSKITSVHLQAED